MCEQGAGAGDKTRSCARWWRPKLGLCAQGLNRISETELWVKWKRIALLLCPSKRDAHEAYAWNPVSQLGKIWWGVLWQRFRGRVLMRMRVCAVCTPLAWPCVLSWWAKWVAQPCPALCDPVDCCPPGSSVRGILQARILEWGGIYQTVTFFGIKNVTSSICWWF